MILKRVCSVIIVLFSLTTSIYGQTVFVPSSIAAQWNLVEYGGRTNALGQATSALDNRLAFNINPAIPAQPGTANFSSYLISASPVQTLAFGKPVLYNPSVSIRRNKWSFGFKMDYTKWGSKPATDETGLDLGYNVTNDKRILRFNAARALSNNLSIGIGFSHLHDDRSLGYNYLAQSGVSADALMLSFGMYYERTLPFYWLNLKPQFGTSLTDIGGSVDFNFDGQNTERFTTPGQLRTSIGLDISTQKHVLNHRFLQLGIYTGISKQMGGFFNLNQSGPSSSTRTAITGLEMVTGTWKTIEQFDGSNWYQVQLSDQILTSFGAELGVVENLYFQIGVMGGADRWIRPQSSYGMALDLNYIAFSYNRITYKVSDRWGFDESWATPVLNIDLRIPIDGRSRKTPATFQLLERFLSWLRNH